MDADAIAGRAAALPARYATRLGRPTATLLRDTLDAGEHRAMLCCLVAALCACRIRITPAERTELVTLLFACRMPTAPVAGIPHAGSPAGYCRVAAYRHRL